MKMAEKITALQQIVSPFGKVYILKIVTLFKPVYFFFEIVGKKKSIDSNRVLVSSLKPT